MRRYIRLGCALTVLLAVAVMAPRIVSSREGVREITVVVRNMTYYLEGSDAPNPSMRLSAGERVRLTLRNEDTGMSHDFNIRDWDVATKVLDGKGEDSIVFRVPARSAGSVAYACTPHSAMMSGSIVVE